MDKIFYRPVFPLFDGHWVGGLPYMLETCRGGRAPITLSVKKTKNFDQVRPSRSCRSKWTEIFYRPVFPLFDAP